MQACVKVGYVSGSFQQAPSPASVRRVVREHRRRMCEEGSAPEYWSTNKPWEIVTGQHKWCRVFYVEVQQSRDAFISRCLVGASGEGESETQPSKILKAWTTSESNSETLSAGDGEREGEVKRPVIELCHLRGMRGNAGLRGVGSGWGVVNGGLRIASVVHRVMLRGHAARRGQLCGQSGRQRLIAVDGELGIVACLAAQMFVRVLLTLGGPKEAEAQGRSASRRELRVPRSAFSAASAPSGEGLEFIVDVDDSLTSRYKLPLHTYIPLALEDVYLDLEFELVALQLVDCLRCCLA
ncbi:hypothetical protein L227DRAFT_568733 [Lentinus tigrinus ALCF2SS1-6]|uniref:Uncharacterized protein n=1 Tax=Lentinus tigrinus ALCF2SS1-6 TaxID=1328759 RepID=A0A5C2RKY9_9APHY|nr:hypothetical protein L227DRAFT_568733 [Lentinus tigrinus ALCF2SS1-6]